MIIIRLCFLVLGYLNSHNYQELVILDKEILPVMVGLSFRL